MSLYPAALPAASPAVLPGGWPPELAGAGIVAIRVADLASPLRRPLREGDRSALAAAGTGRLRTGDLMVFCKPVAVARWSAGTRTGCLSWPRDPRWVTTTQPSPDSARTESRPVTRGIGGMAITLGKPSDSGSRHDLILCRKARSALPPPCCCRRPASGPAPSRSG